MVGHVADVTAMLERNSEGRRVVRLALHPASHLCTACKVVAVVADVSSSPHPEWSPLHRFRHREQQWLHSCNTYTHMDTAELAMITLLFT